VEGAGAWASVRDASAFAGREGVVWRVSVKPTDGPKLGARLGGAEVIYDWAGGLVWVLGPEELDVRGAMAGVSGHATLVRAGAETRARWGSFHPEPAPVAAIAAGLRARFDPAGILNRRAIA
jgi:glycolate oxidase FAD binding subunit